MKCLQRVFSIPIMAFAVLVTIFPSNSIPAEIRQEPRGQFEGEKVGGIHIIGNIELGDEKKFEQALENFSAQGIVTLYVTLASRGGSVTAAMEIGRIVRRYGLQTQSPIYGACCEFKLMVEKNWCAVLDFEYDLLTSEGNPDCECTSACALIWAAGTTRSGTRVGFHRPYLDKDQIKELSFSETESDLCIIFFSIQTTTITFGD